MNRVARVGCAVSKAAVLVAMSVALFAGAASAHEPGTTGIELEIGDASVDAVFDLPLEPLEAALGTPVATDALGLSMQRELLVGYVADHLEVSSASGVWTESFGRLTAVTVAGSDTLRLEAALTPADGSAIDEFDLRYDGLVEHDAAQLVFVTALDESGDVTLAGVLDDDTPAIAVGAEPSSSDGTTIGLMIREGFDHVLDGADHMLFLLVLLLPAPLTAMGRRWHVGGGRWSALRKVVHVATAFTIGHSATLMMSALGWVHIPTRTIEVLIGVSVAVSAVHAIRPLITGGEVVIAGTFGLIHGLAFAGILDGLGLEAASLASLFGFNIGIEAAQLAIIACTFPSLYVMSRRPLFGAVRIGLATTALAASVGWVVERLSIVDSPFGGIESALVDHLAWVVVVLALCAATATATATATAGSARELEVERLHAGDGVETERREAHAMAGVLHARPRQLGVEVVAAVEVPGARLDLIAERHGSFDIA